MLRNYIIVALRSLWKNKGFSAINIAGLALGMACSLLIVLWVKDEKSVDAFHAQGDRLYRITGRTYFDGKTGGQYGMPGLLARQLKRDIPEVQMATTYLDMDVHTFMVGDKLIKEKGASADSDYFRMFSYPLLAGRAEDALSGPLSIAISRQMAVNFFGNPASALGQTIRYDNKHDFKVTAVFDDLPANVSEKFDFVLNWDFLLNEYPFLKPWDNFNPEVNVLLYPHARPEAVSPKILHFLDKFIQAADGPNPGWKVELNLQPYKEVYLYNHFGSDGHPDGGRIEYVHLFSLVALFILLIACINFMNLTTARSIKRAKEIGVRKVLGAARGLLIRQFMGEAIVLAFISALVAMILVELILPAFNQLTGKQIALPLGLWTTWVLLLGLVMVSGILSGSYPALVLSAFNPVRVLKGGTLRAGPGALWFRKGLVVFQFVLSIVLIISTILISRQIRYVEEANLGYDRENLVYIPIEGDLLGKIDLFRTEATRLPGVSMVSVSGEPPTQVDNWTIGVQWPGKDPKAKPAFNVLGVGYDFTKTMGMQMAQGRDYSRDFPSDSVGYILNKAAVAKIGYKDPIGQPLTFWGHPGRIVGIMEDVHFHSLRDVVNPMVIHLEEKDNEGVFLVRTQAGKTRQALSGLEQLCKTLNPKFPFTYQFSSEEYTKLYKSEELVGRLSVIFAALAIVISCLGLLGLSIFTAVQRTKEIGIRKVLGAGMLNLFNLLSREFLVLVGIAFAIAGPLAWWAMNEWLRHFAYRTPVSWWIFAASGAIAFAIALATVCYQAIRTAKASPIKSLRTE
ncbi:ABC transporter permease [Dinghuibacter silviterrae]|uniref:Putative permease n=1 Tax=Dinghuibacter silviterrae TaxID=1539049 RepID=A0A4R8DK71_9BACT|nr:ABC transporter permease [Dinghuibacter silviterrae]TDW97410.1 putative permease [Dinghuibacter silviterrae]